MTKRVPYLTLLLGALALAIHAVPGLTETLQFDRQAISRAEIWRFVTGHFTHFGADHLRWDVIALIAFGSLVELRSRKRFLLCVGFTAFVVSAGVSVFLPHFSTYRGLSGVDSALFGFVAADVLRIGWRERERLMAGFALLALAGFLAKTLYEISTGLTLFVAPSADFETVPLAHLLGVIVGALSALSSEPRHRTQTSLSLAPSKQANERVSSHAAQ